MKICTHIKSTFTPIACGVILLLASCGDIYDLNGFDWEADTPASDSVFNRQIQIFDLGPNNIPEGHRPLDSSDPLYFSLEKFSSIHLGYKTTERWDIALAGMYRTSIVGNNGKIAGYGYGSTGIGGVVVLDQPYDEVVDVPDDSQFVAPGNAGLDAQGAFGSGLGHVIYTFFGNFVRPEINEALESNDPAVVAEANLYQHMMYALSEDFVAAFPDAKNVQGTAPLRPRTVVIRTARGNYAKLETQSYYKGVTDPLLMRRGTDMPVGYVSFRYIVIKADEKRFGFVERQPSLTVNLTTNRTTVGE